MIWVRGAMVVPTYSERVTLGRHVVDSGGLAEEHKLRRAIKLAKPSPMGFGKDLQGYSKVKPLGLQRRPLQNWSADKMKGRSAPIVQLFELLDVVSCGEEQPT